MPTFTPVYLNPAANYLSRGLTQGFAIRDITVDAYVQVGRFFSWTIGTVSVVVAMKSEYFDWNSGLWPLGDIWSIPECHVFVSGNEVDGGVFFFYDWTPDRANMVQCGSIFFPGSSFITFALPPAPDDYWLKLPPLS